MATKNSDIDARKETAIKRLLWLLLTFILSFSQIYGSRLMPRWQASDFAALFESSQSHSALKNETYVSRNSRTGKISATITVWPSIDGMEPFNETFWQTEDLGKNWRRVGRSDVVYDPSQLGNHPADPQTTYRISGEVGLKVFLERSVDAGRTWQAAKARIKGTDTVLSSYVFQAFHPQEPTTLYVIGSVLGSAEMNGSDLVGLYVSHDRGDSFELIATNVNGQTLAISKSNPQVMFAGTFYQYVIKSENGGRSWRVVGPFALNSAACSSQAVPVYDKSGESGTGLHLIHHIEINEHDDENVYAQSDIGIWKTSDGGQHWCLLKVSSDPDIKVGSLVVVADASAQVIFVGTSSGLFISRDNGQTWSRVDLRAYAK